MSSVMNVLSYIHGHPLCRANPVAGWGRFVGWQIRSRLQHEVVVDWLDGAKLLVRNGMTGATGNIYCGLHEFCDMAFLLHLLRPDDMFVDIGANVGSYTILASKVVGCSVIAFEPDPETGRALRANVALNGVSGRVALHEIALGAEDGEARFTIGRDTTNRVAREHETDARVVPMRALDNVLAGRAPTLIKMDVEGFEASVALGASRTFSDERLLAVETETSDEVVCKELEQAGFVRRYYDPFTRSLSEAPGKVAASNSLFVRNLPEVRTRLEQAPRRRVFGTVF